MGRKNKTPDPQPAEPRPTDEMLEKMFLKGVLLFFAVVAMYIPAMYGGYIYDDDQLLTSNPLIQRGSGFTDPESWRGLAYFWFPIEARGAADYFPATSTMLWAEWRLFGNNDPKVGPVTGGFGAPGYHIVNILMHAGCVVLLWLVLERMSIPGGWLAALIWGIHPVGVESVAWISELKNTLSMFLFLIMMLFWIRFLKWERAWEYAVATKPKSWSGLKTIASRKKWYYGLTIALFVITLLAKTAVVMMPFVLLLHIWWEGRREERWDWHQVLYFSGVMAIFVFWVMIPASLLWIVPDWGNYPSWAKIMFPTLGVFALVVTPIAVSALKWLHARLILVLRQSVPFFVISYAFGIVTWYFQVKRAIGNETVPIGNMLHRFSGACFALGFYLYKIILPVNLMLIYPQWHDPTWHGALPVIVQILPGIAIAGLIYWAWRNRETWGRHVLFAMGFFAITLFPILGFVKMAYMRLTLVADHFEYTSMVSIIALCVAGVIHYRRHLSKPMIYILDGSWICVVILFGLLTLQRAAVFADTEKLWRDTLAKNPDSWQAHSHLGAILYRRGDIDGALANWQESVRLKPYLYEVHNNLGLALTAKGRIEEALVHYKTAVDIDGSQPPVRMNYADGLRVARHYDEAIVQYKELLKISPNNPVAYVDMGVVYFTIGKLDEAIDCFQKAVRIAPDYPDARHDLDVALQKKQQESGVPAPKVINRPPVNAPQNPFIQTPGPRFNSAVTPPPPGVKPEARPEAAHSVSPSPR